MYTVRLERAATGLGPPLSRTEAAKSPAAFLLAGRGVMDGVVVERGRARPVPPIFFS